MPRDVSDVRASYEDTTLLAAIVKKHAIMDGQKETRFLPETTSECQESFPTRAKHVVTVHLRNIPLLKGLDKVILERVASSLQIRSVARGGVLLRKGSCSDYLLFLLSGRLQSVDVTDEGREVGITFLGPGDYFGDLAVIDGLPLFSSVVACEASLVAFMPREQAIELIYNNPLVAERVLKRMASKIRAAFGYRAILAIPNAFQRVFALLNQFAKTAPGGVVIIEKMPTQQEIAILANTSRETVSRAIHTLIQKGVVEKDMRRLIVRLPDLLREAVAMEQRSANERA